MPPATRGKPCGALDPSPARAHPLGYRRALSGLLWPRSAGTARASASRKRGGGPFEAPPAPRDGVLARGSSPSPQSKKTSRQWRNPRRHPPQPGVASPSRGTVRATLTTRYWAVLASWAKADRRGSTRAAQTVEPRDASSPAQSEDAPTTRRHPRSGEGHPPKRLAAGGSPCTKCSTKLGGSRCALPPFLSLSPAPPIGPPPRPDPCQPVHP